MGKRLSHFHREKKHLCKCLQEHYKAHSHRKLCFSWHSIQRQWHMLQCLFTMYFSSISFEQIVLKLRKLCHLGLLILLPPNTNKQTKTCNTVIMNLNKNKTLWIKLLNKMAYDYLAAVGEQLSLNDALRKWKWHSWDGLMITTDSVRHSYLLCYYQLRCP